MSFEITNRDLMARIGRLETKSGTVETPLLLPVINPNLQTIPPQKLEEKFDDVPTGALGLYTYMERLDQGLKQIMAGCRKFALEYIDRNDIAALTHNASDISGIPYIMECDKEEAEKIIKG